MARRAWNWTKNQLDKLNKVQAILKEFEKYKPLTLRQIFYQLVGKAFIENTVSQYGMLSNLIKWARIDKKISWDDIEDRIRVFHSQAGWDDKDEFIEEELSKFLEEYRRDLLQTQNKFIEIWIEKDALASIFTRVCSPYGISVVVCRGFSSISFLNNYRARAEYYYSNGKRPIMLYFGDFDPSGMEMLDAMKTTFEDELGLTAVEYKRVALVKGDIFKYKLPHNPKAIKKNDTRTDKHIEKYGELAVELDALNPDILVNKIKMAIEKELDIEAFNKEVEKHKRELSKLDKLKNKVKKFIDGQNSS